MGLSPRLLSPFFLAPRRNTSPGSLVVRPGYLTLLCNETCILHREMECCVWFANVSLSLWDWTRTVWDWDNSLIRKGTFHLSLKWWPRTQFPQVKQLRWWSCFIGRHNLMDPLESRVQLWARWGRGSSTDQQCRAPWAGERGNLCADIMRSLE